MVCNKQFEKSRKVFLHTLKQRAGRHFCSRTCKLNYFRPITMVKVKCHGCHAEFEIESGRYTSRHRENHGIHYCNRSCYYLHNHGKTPFGYFIDKSRSRNRWEYDIDPEFLSELWKKQNGKCAYTGITMILPESKKRFCKYRSIEKASLDRIDTTKGYLKGNVEFVCQGINFAKHDYSKQEVMSFIQKIKSTQ
jgi:hypothetical protein